MRARCRVFERTRYRVCVVCVCVCVCRVYTPSTTPHTTIGSACGGVAHVLAFVTAGHRMLPLNYRYIDFFFLFFPAFFCVAQQTHVLQEAGTVDLSSHVDFCALKHVAIGGGGGEVRVCTFERTQITFASRRRIH